MLVNLSVGPGVDVPVDRIFFASSAAATSSAGLATTFTGGVCISNPPGSNVLLIPLWASSTAVVITAAVTSAGIITGYSPAGITVHTTPLQVWSSYVGTNQTSQAKADQACTLVGTPAWIMTGIASSGIAAGVWATTVSLQGLQAIGPGGYIAVGTSIASASAGHMATIGWAELRLPG